MTTVVLVTGPREPLFGADLKVSLALNAQWEKHGHITVLEGGAIGVDSIARHWAEIGISIGYGTFITIRPRYDLYGRGAPFVRNQEMVDRKPAVALAFLQRCTDDRCQRAQPHWTHGTDDCLKRIERAGIEHERILL